MSAPRTIFYGHLGVYWERRTIKALQGFSQSQVDQENVKTSLVTLARLALEAANAPTLESTFHTRWRALIGLYTHCHLTRSSDKLIALSEITNEIENVSGRKYVKGLWMDDIDDGLLWYVKNATWLDSSSPEIMSGRVSNGLPTWSWASTMGPVSYTLPTGPISWRARIVVENEQRHLRVFSWKRQVRVHEDEGEDLVLIKDKSLPGDYEQTYVWWADDLKTKNYGQMWLWKIQRVSISQDPLLSAARCLVIESANDGLFQRIGWCILRYNHKRYDPFPDDDERVEYDAAIVLE